VITAPNTSDIVDNIQNLLKKDEIHYQDHFESEFRGCRLTQTFTGVTSDGNSFGNLEQEYKDEDTKPICGDLNVILLYLETYRLGDEIISRQYNDNTFARVDPDSNTIIASDPQQHLRERFLGSESLEILSTDLRAGITTVRIAFEHVDQKVEMSLDFRQGNEIAEITYDLIFRDAETLSGAITFHTPYGIAPPSLFEGEDPDFLLSALTDIRSYSGVTYSINTGLSFIWTDSYEKRELIVDLYETSEGDFQCKRADSDCQQVEFELASLLGHLEILLQDAEIDYCPPSEPSRAGEITSPSEEYQGLIGVGVFNKGRIEGDDFDSSIEVKFDIEGEAQGDYSGTLRYGKKYCFVGHVDGIALNSFEDLLHDFAQSFR
jgi:hypothetical protein